jgi:predicted metal-binding membrane protein
MHMRVLSRPVPLAVFVLGAALAAWIVTVERMRGMDAGPGTSLGGLGWFVGIWTTMMAAMMLPSAVPMVLIYAKVAASRKGRADFVPTWVFVAGYLAAWTLVGLTAFGVYRAIVAPGAGYLAWDRAGQYVAGGALIAAGLYELTPLKNVCLRHCRGPLHFVLGHWRPGWLGAFRMGAEHGAYCVGCCWGLMLALFALGVMSLFWMAVVAAVIFAEKLVPRTQRLPVLFATLLVGLGVWVAAAPASVPGLVEPNSDGAQHARMRMMHMEPDKAKMGGMPAKKGEKPAKMGDMPGYQQPAMP